MTIVTITDNEIRGYNHAGRTGLCIAISAILQNTARILHAGRALGAYELTEEPPLCAITAAIGDYLPFEEPVPDQIRVAKEITGRKAFVKAVFDGTKATLDELVRLNGSGNLEIKDQRAIEERPTKSSTRGCVVAAS